MNTAKDFVNLGRTPEEKDLIDRKAAIFYLEKELESIRKEVKSLNSFLNDERKFGGQLYSLQRAADNYICLVRKHQQESFTRESKTDKKEETTNA